MTEELINELKELVSPYYHNGKPKTPEEVIKAAIEVIKEFEEMNNGN